jgi:hypothetical protein
MVEGRDPLIIFAHVPRTAGTSIAQWLRDAAVSGHTTGHANLYGLHGFQSEHDLRAAGLGDPRVETAASHDIRTFPRRLADREAHYFTILREPLERFGSRVRYMLLHRKLFGVPSSLRRVEDVARLVLDARYGELGVENEQTNHFALYTWCQRNLDCDPARYALWSSDQHHAYWRERLGIATEALCSFLCVGVMRDVTGSLRTLCRRAEKLGICLPRPEAVTFVNYTERHEGDEDYLYRGPLAEEIRASMRDDFQLYAVAESIFRAQCEALPGSRGTS